MKYTLNRTASAGVLCVGLTACGAPTLVSLQPIGAPQPTNAQQTFVDADRCSWWIIGNGDELRWAPMTNSAGEHVCDGGATQIDPPSTGTAAPEPRGDTFADEMRKALDAPIEATVPATAVPAATATETAPRPANPLSGGKAHYVQVATFARESNVVASEKLFKSLGYTIQSGSAERDNDRLYRLILGPFRSRDDAQEAVDRAFNEGFDDAFPFRR